jgi:formylglycine-generating enzyme required for sulfatase activity
VAALPNGDFHEVFRRIPEPGDDHWRGGYPHDTWTIGEAGRIEMPGFEIPLASGFDDMARFAGSDDFIVGAKELSVSPPHHRRQPAFLLDTTEVTVSQFREVMQRLPAGLADDLPAENDAVSFVNFEEALAFAERVGKRLMTEVEYEFAATDGGRLEVPWGGRAADIHDWPFGPVRNPTFDRLEHEPPVFGLYSNVTEWTSSWGTLYPDAQGRPRPSLPTASVERIVRGGPVSVMMGTPDAKEWREGSRTRVMFLKSRQERGLGFRCARSVAPRVRPDDFATCAP